jgi:FKBP-type peptidyl-prolyl cis-trans isomerase 2
VSAETVGNFVVGDEELFSGFDTALKSMKAKEEAEFTFQPAQAFGSTGNSELNIPADAVVKATVKVEMVSIVGLTKRDRDDVNDKGFDNSVTVPSFAVGRGA